MHVRRAPDGSVSERLRLAAGQASPSPSVTVPDLAQAASLVEQAEAAIGLWVWGLAAFSDSTELVLSELVTNAVQASRAMRDAAIRMWLVSDRAQIVVFVWDASPQPPARADLGEDAGNAENGRGLLLVEAVSELWGHFPDGAAGKVVWAVIPTVRRSRAGASP